MDAHTIGTMSDIGQPEYLIPPMRVDGSVTLAEPDPVWGEWYAREEERIRTALGSRTLAVEHVGSTSVPGLAAKPVIDIVLVVADSSDEAGYVPDLQDAGYQNLHIAVVPGVVLRDHFTEPGVVLTRAARHGWRSRSVSSASARIS